MCGLVLGRRQRPWREYSQSDHLFIHAVGFSVEGFQFGDAFGRHLRAFDALPGETHHIGELAHLGASRPQREKCHEAGPLYGVALALLLGPAQGFEVARRGIPEFLLTQAHERGGFFFFLSSSGSGASSLTCGGL